MRRYVKPITVDSHEPGEIARWLGEWADVHPLEAGDYAFHVHDSKLVLVERKSADDLLNSLANGVLADELSRCIATTEYVVLLIEGWLSATIDGKIRTQYRQKGDGYWRWAFLWNFLMTAQLSGVFLYQSPSIRHTPQVIINLYEYFQRPERRSILRIRQPLPKYKNVTALNALACCQDISIGTAKSLLAYFGTLEKIVQADEKALKACPMVGPTRARKLYEFFRAMWENSSSGEMS